MSYLLLKICLITISIIFWFTKNFIIKLTLGLFLRYPYILGDFHPDILIEAILIKKACMKGFLYSPGCWSNLKLIVKNICEIAFVGNTFIVDKI